MKKILLFNLLFLSCVVFSQTNYDTRLNVKYTNSYLESLSQDKIQSLEFKLDNIYFIMDNFEKNPYLPELYKIDYSTKKVVKTPLTNIDFNNFNILEYNFEQNYNNRTYYKIGNTGKTLVVYSGKEYAEKFNEFKNK